MAVSSSRKIIGANISFFPVQEQFRVEMVHIHSSLKIFSGYCAGIQ